jgi:hypothetical protein
MGGNGSCSKIWHFATYPWAVYCKRCPNLCLFLDRQRFDRGFYSYTHLICDVAVSIQK